ncbi:hypothetical protein BGZ83_000129 [Gryganskiella cystojenkinii]|nr:hypothetical protein BGZ83_000129 [Gryganskiella cystojenkinii]
MFEFTLSLIAAVALANLGSVQAQTTPPIISPTTAPTTAPVITTPPTHSTSFVVHSSSSFSISTSTASVGPSPGGSSSSTSPSSPVPAIVGSIAGVAAFIIIVATSVICYRRRRRNNRELTFDALQGMSGPAITSGKTRQSMNYLANSNSPAIGLNSVTSGGYDDGYDYEMQSNAGYPVQHHNYNNSGFEGYSSGSPHPGYHPSPTIFQEDHLQHQAAASGLPVAAAFATNNRSMGRSRTGFDQNLPEVMYNGVEDHAAATGYYNDDDIYNQAHGGWNGEGGQYGGGYVGPQGLWVANPEALRRQEEESAYYNDQHHGYTEDGSESNLITSSVMTPAQFPSAHSLESTTLVPQVGEVSPTRSKFRSSGNPQAIPEDSPILKSTTLRGGGDVFAQESARPSSPRVAAREAASGSSSPRLTNTREMRSFEISRQSPSSRSSGEHAQSYATDYVRPSIDVTRSASPTTAGGPASPLNPNKSLRTLRREDWS